jgi:GNAT superfamily N-acetyltransferase/SAM-dependent methyltransferase
LLSQPPTFEQLLHNAQVQPFSGWDFAWLAGRLHESPPPWNYREHVQRLLPTAQTLLDMGTGGGEFLASLQPLPPHTYATEAYLSNVPIAQACLEPLAVQVVALESDYHLPFDDNTFDLIINRHEMFIAEEVARILRPGGRFITQQVGERNLAELNEWLTGQPLPPRSSRLETALNYLRQAGLEMIKYQEAFPDVTFADMGAVVYFLQAVPWQLKRFTAESYRQRLADLHNHIQQNGPFLTRAHRYLIQARQPLQALRITAHDQASPEAQALQQQMYVEIALLYGDPTDGSFTGINTNQPGATFLVAWAGEQAVGCIALIPFAPGTGEIKRVFVEPAWRGQGISQALLAAIEERARSMGYHRVCLETGQLQPAAIKLYERTGYHRIPPYGRWADDPLTACFAKEL